MSLVLTGPGSGQYGSRSGIYLPNYPFSISIWFNSDSQALSQAVASIEIIATTNNLNSVLIYGSIDDTVRAMSYDTAWVSAITTSQYTAGTWHNAVAVFNSSTDRRIYIDGGSKGVNTSLQNAIACVNLLVGAYNNGNGLFDGKLAELGIWNSALSDADALLLATLKPNYVQTGSLISYLPLLSDANDDIGTWDLTLNGGPSFDTLDHPDLGVIMNAIGGLTEWDSLAVLPEAKDQFGFEELNGLLYAVCGLTTGSVHSKKVYAYNPLTNTWSAKADAPLAVQSPVLKAVNGKLYLIGGYRSDLSLKYDKCYEYNPSSDLWIEKTPAPVAFEDAYSAVANGKIYIFGGLTNPGHTMIPWIQIYDPSNDSWAQVSWATPRALGDGASAILDNGKILIISGTDDMGGYPSDLRTVVSAAEYDVAGQSWSEKATVPYSRAYHEAEEINGLIYTLGGVHTDLSDFLSTELVYDVALNKWSSKKNTRLYALGGITGAGMTKYNGSVYFCGGYGNVGGSYTFFDGLYRYTPPDSGSGSGTLTKISPPAPPIIDICVINLFSVPTDLTREA